MELLLDTIHLADIQRYQKTIQLAGVTSNPTIIKKEGRVPFFDHLRKIRQIIGPKASLHVQVVGGQTAEMVEDAHEILQNIDSEVFIKVPTNEAGLAAMKILKAEGVHITATAIYTEMQGYLAMSVGADYLAPYYNRMLNMGIDASQIIAAWSKKIAHEHLSTKTLAASFHNVDQINQALRSGAQAITTGPDILDTALATSVIGAAIQDFTHDWESVYGAGCQIKDLK